MNKKEKNSIIIGVFLAIIIFLAILFSIFNYILPNILEIEKNKEILTNSIEKYNDIEKNGLTYNDFSSLKNNLKQEKYKKVLENIDKGFYNKVLYTQEKQKFPDFISYIDNKNKTLELEKKSSKYKKNIDSLEKILPLYISDNDTKKGLSDLAFISYIETILNKFDITTKSDIGIKNIKEAEPDISGDIYYIPLELELTGLKGKIIDFINYINKSGNIEIVNNKLNIKNNKQLAEVEKISLKKYIDSSSQVRENYNTNLKDFLASSNQLFDEINIKLKLRFYIKQLSSNKLREKIEEIIGNKNILKYKDGEKIKTKLLHYNYKNILAITKKLKSNKNIQENKFYNKKLISIIKYLNSKELKKDILSIKKEKNIDIAYRKALKYKKIFLELDNKLYNIALNLDLVRDKKDKNGKIISKSIYPKNYLIENE